MGALDDQLACALSAQGCHVCRIALDYREHQAACKGIEERVFGLCNNIPADAALLIEPPNASQSHMVSYWLQGQVRPGGRLIYVSSNTAGPAGLDHTIKTAALDVRHHYGAHARLWEGEVRCVEHASISPWSSVRTLTIGGTPPQVVDFPGLFSRGHLDPGSELLLRTLKPPEGGRLLDLGCGAGSIGLSLKLQSPKLAITMADVDWLALEATRLGASANGLTGSVRIVPSDAYIGINEKFDFIVTNPPFHKRGSFELQTANRFIAGAPEHLAPGGRLVVVGNRGLNYGRLLQQRFRSVRTLAGSEDYEVFDAS